ncbi:hypothetical protein J2S43_007129 [Catenuloplanes nepalensis]|uniref:DUF397 domain-containing protein n=1 Tax=Catenuloplanes nepalensis TaxID=587533 RepID=A0ABT9N4J4_9ACTN|nr:DUF397 domain-containing protein [Catenuloplanes nepalensis]MDP9798617.1 hypothetical protein [Catenuloplanes nepalensis]
MDNLIWKKSTRSSPNGGHCVEVAVTPSNLVLVRDSKSQLGPILRYSISSWREFIRNLDRR